MFLYFVLFILIFFDSTLAGVTRWRSRTLKRDRPLTREATLETKSDAPIGFQDASVSIKVGEFFGNGSQLYVALFLVDAADDDDVFRLYPPMHALPSFAPTDGDDDDAAPSPPDGICCTRSVLDQRNSVGLPPCEIGEPQFRALFKANPVRTVKPPMKPSTVRTRTMQPVPPPTIPRPTPSEQMKTPKSTKPEKFTTDDDNDRSHKTHYSTRDETKYFSSILSTFSSTDAGDSDQDHAPTITTTHDDDDDDPSTTTFFQTSARQPKTTDDDKMNNNMMNMMMSMMNSNNNNNPPSPPEQTNNNNNNPSNSNNPPQSPPPPPLPPLPTVDGNNNRRMMSTMPMMMMSSAAAAAASMPGGNPYRNVAANPNRNNNNNGNGDGNQRRRRQLDNFNIDDIIYEEQQNLIINNNNDDDNGDVRGVVDDPEESDKSDTDDDDEKEDKESPEEELIEAEYSVESKNPARYWVINKSAKSWSSGAIVINQTSGLYRLIIVSCEDDAVFELNDVEIVFQNPYGYLSASQFANMPMHIFLATAYLLMMIAWTVQLLRRQQGVVRMHLLLLIVYVFAFISEFVAALDWSLYNYWSGFVSLEWNVVTAIAVPFRHVTCWLFLLLVCLGYDVYVYSLDTRRRIMIIVAIVVSFVVTGLHESMSLFSLTPQLEKVKLFGGITPTIVEGAKTLSDLLICAWICCELAFTIRNLKLLKQSVKLQRYKVTAFIIGICLSVYTILFITEFILEISADYSDFWRENAVFDILWPLLLLLILIVAFIVVRPTLSSEYQMTELADDPRSRPTSSSDQFRSARFSHEFDEARRSSASYSSADNNNNNNNNNNDDVRRQSDLESSTTADLDQLSSSSASVLAHVQPIDSTTTTSTA